VPDELTWDQRILRRIESGIDVTQIDRNLKLTPTERLEQMEAMLRDLEEMRGPPRRSFKDFLASMPTVGEDEDYVFQRDIPREPQW
jgi:hypothetical protein